MLKYNGVQIILISIWFVNNFFILPKDDTNDFTTKDK